MSQADPLTPEARARLEKFAHDTRELEISADIHQALASHDAQAAELSQLAARVGELQDVQRLLTDALEDAVAKLVEQCRPTLAESQSYIAALQAASPRFVCLALFGAPDNALNANQGTDNERP